MHSSSHTMFTRLALLLLLVLPIASCSNSADSFPRVANPPDFDFVDGQELRTGMHQLAFELQRLDLALMSLDDGNPAYQSGVITNLRNIERIAGFLRSGDISSRHPFLRSDMDRFLLDVRRAREDAERGTPRYYMAGRVSGACVNCHRANE